MSYTGSTTDLTFLPPLFAQERVHLDSYVLLGATARYDVNRLLEVFARVENALDERYEDVFGFRAPGIAGYAGVRLRFAPP